MIYTSYFAKLKSLPTNVIPISICAKVPDWYNGLQYKELAPSYNLLMHWKQHGDEEYYRSVYDTEVLNKLSPHGVIFQLSNLVGGDLSDKDIVLLCYEKSDSFCHRHIVADWLSSYGYECKEWVQ